MVEPAHDPGPDAAAARISGIAEAAAQPIAMRGGHAIRVGTASWTDPTMTVPGSSTRPARTPRRSALPSTRAASPSWRSTPPTTPFRRGGPRSCGCNGRHRTSRSTPRPMRSSRASQRRRGACRRTCEPPCRLTSLPRLASTRRTFRPSCWTTSGRGSSMASNRFARRASSARCCSSTRDGSSRHPKIATRSRCPRNGFGGPA